MSASIRTFTETISLPSGTPAGLRELKTTLDAEYDHASGVVTYINKDGGIPSFKLGLRDDTAVYATPTNANFYSASLDCPKNQRLTPVTIPCTGRQLTIQLDLSAPLTSELNVDVVFALEAANRGR